MKGLLIALAVLAVLTAAAAAPFLVLWRDGLSFFTYHALAGLMALKHFAGNALSHGHYPLWNPGLMGGIPFHTGIGILDPFLISYAFLNSFNALLLSAGLEIFCAGLFMYLYLRRIHQLSFGAAILGSVLYSANPFFIATCHELPFMAPPVFLPLVMLCYEQGRKDQLARWFVLAGLALALSFFSGNLESSYLIILFIASIRLCIAAAASFREGTIQGLKEEFVSLAATVLCFILLAGFEIIPTLAMIPDAARDSDARALHNLIHFAIVAAAAGAFTVLALLLDARVRGRRWQLYTFILCGLALLFMLQVDRARGFIEWAPNFFYPNMHMLMSRGRGIVLIASAALGVDPLQIKNHFEPRFIFYVQPPAYIFNLASLFLFFAGLRKCSHHVRCLAFFALLMILFPYSPLPNIFTFLFGLQALNYPRIMFGFFFIQSVVVSCGFQALTARTVAPTYPSWLRPFVVPCAIFSAGALTLVLVAGFHPPPWERLAPFFETSGGVLTMSLNHLRITLNVLARLVYEDYFIKAALIFKYSSMVALALILLRQRSLLARTAFIVFFSLETLLGWSLYAFQKDDYLTIVRPHPEGEFLKSIKPEERVGTFWDPAFTIYNFYPRSHTVELSSNLPLFWDRQTVEEAGVNLQPRRARDFWLFEPGNTSWAPANIQTVPSNLYDLFGMKYLFTDIPPQDSSYRPVKSGARYAIYENTRALSRFYFPEQILELNRSEMPARLMDRSWDPRKASFIAPGESLNLPALNGPGYAQVTEESNDRVLVRVEAAGAGLLATTDAYHPGWKAWMDGKPAAVHAVNFYFRSVWVPAGSHTIEFRYFPPFLRLGAAMTSAGLLILAFCCLRRIHLPAFRAGS